MNILSFSYCFPNRKNPDWGVFVLQRLEALARLVSLQVCAPVPWFPLLTARRGNPGPVDDHLNGLNVHRPRFFYVPGYLKDHDARLYALGLHKWLKAQCRNRPPQILDAHFVWPDGVGVALLAGALGLPYAITLRGKLYECLKVPAQRRQCAAALKGAAAVISVSGPLAAEALKLGVPAKRLHVIPNGVDRARLHPRDKIDCRRRLGLPEAGRLLVTVAHLGHRKGHHEVIRTLPGLPGDVRLVIVGGAAQGGTPEALMKTAREAGVAGRLILAGRQPYDRVPLYYCAADASVLASYREGCPNVVLESLACGTPVVASDVGAVRDILPVPAAGAIVPPREEAPLGDALGQVLGRRWDPETVVEKSGIKSWEQVAEKVHAVLQEAVSEGFGKE